MPPTFAAARKTYSGLVCAKNAGYGLLVAQVKFGRGTGYKIGKPFALQLAHVMAEPTIPRWPAIYIFESFSFIGH
jgi:hypothetical protein